MACMPLCRIEAMLTKTVQCFYASKYLNIELVLKQIVNEAKSDIAGDHFG